MIQSTCNQSVIQWKLHCNCCKHQHLSIPYPLLQDEHHQNNLFQLLLVGVACRISRSLWFLYEIYHKLHPSLLFFFIVFLLHALFLHAHESELLFFTQYCLTDCYNEPHHLFPRLHRILTQFLHHYQFPPHYYAIISTFLDNLCTLFGHL
jgi:hypothetical protein